MILEHRLIPDEMAWLAGSEYFCLEHLWLRPLAARQIPDNNRSVPRSSGKIKRKMRKKKKKNNDKKDNVKKNNSQKLIPRKRE